MFTWSLAWASSPASSAITSFAFMFDEVPEPVWKTSIGNWSSCLPSAISWPAWAIRSAMSESSRPSSPLTAAAVPLMRPEPADHRNGHALAGYGEVVDGLGGLAAPQLLLGHGHGLTRYPSARDPRTLAAPEGGARAVHAGPAPGRPGAAARSAAPGVCSTPRSTAPDQVAEPHGLGRVGALLGHVGQLGGDAVDRRAQRLEVRGVAPSVMQAEIATPSMRTAAGAEASAACTACWPCRRRPAAPSSSPQPAASASSASSHLNRVRPPIRCTIPHRAGAGEHGDRSSWMWRTSAKERASAHAAGARLPRDARSACARPAGWGCCCGAGRRSCPGPRSRWWATTCGCTR